MTARSVRLVAFWRAWLVTLPAAKLARLEVEITALARRELIQIIFYVQIKFRPLFHYKLSTRLKYECIIRIFFPFKLAWIKRLLGDFTWKKHVILICILLPTGLTTWIAYYGGVDPGRIERRSKKHFPMPLVNLYILYHNKF